MKVGSLVKSRKGYGWGIIEEIYTAFYEENSEAKVLWCSPPWIQPVNSHDRRPLKCLWERFCDLEVICE